MGISLWVSGVNLGVGGYNNAEQLVCPDHHPAHLKGVMVFHKSTIPLCSNTLVVMSPHSLVAVTDHFQLSLRPEAALAESTGNSYPLPVLLLGGSYGQCICVWAHETVPRGCIHSRVGHILPWQVLFRWGLISGTPQASCHSTIIRISSGPSWTGRGLPGFCPHCSKLDPASSTN